MLIEIPLNSDPLGEFPPIVKFQFPVQFRHFVEMIHLSSDWKPTWKQVFPPKNDWKNKGRPSGRFQSAVATNENYAYLFGGAIGLDNDMCTTEIV
jgi:hypothetical protein